jgi:hypothetical protein
LTPDDAAKVTKKHRDAVDKLTEGEKKLIDKINRAVFHTGKVPIKLIERIGLALGGRGGVVCRPGGGAQ